MTVSLRCPGIACIALATLLGACRTAPPPPPEAETSNVVEPRAVEQPVDSPPAEHDTASDAEAEAPTTEAEAEAPTTDAVAPDDASSPGRVVVRPRTAKERSGVPKIHRCMSEDSPQR